jgi:hypothetical protein
LLLACALLVDSYLTYHRAFALTSLACLGLSLFAEELATAQVRIDASGGDLLWTAPGTGEEPRAFAALSCRQGQCSYVAMQPFEHGMISAFGANGEHVAQARWTLPTDTLLDGFVRYRGGAQVLGCMNIENSDFRARAVYDGEADRLDAFLRSREFDVDIRLDQGFWGRAQFARMTGEGADTVQTYGLIQYDSQHRAHQFCLVQGSQDFFAGIYGDQRGVTGAWRERGLAAGFQVGDRVDRYGYLALSDERGFELWAFAQDPLVGPPRYQAGLEMRDFLRVFFDGYGGPWRAGVDFLAADRFRLTFRGSEEQSGARELAFGCSLASGTGNPLDLALHCSREPNGRDTYQAGASASFRPTANTICTGGGRLVMRPDGSRGLELDASLLDPGYGALHCWTHFDQNQRGGAVTYETLIGFELGGATHTFRRRGRQ